MRENRPVTKTGTTTQTSAVKDDIQNIDAKINLLAQKLKTMEKNLEVVGRTIIALNDKIEKMSKLKASTGTTSSDDFDKKYASKEEFMELKSLMEQVNPLSFATINEVKELVDEKIEKAIKQK